MTRFPGNATHPSELSSIFQKKVSDMAENQDKARILIVEDEVLIAADLESRLKGLGYTVCGTATTGAKALELVEKHQPNLVMMDIVLSGEGDGIDAAEFIKEKWGIPVVFLTAYADTDRLERAKLTSPFGYLLKPFQDRDLTITTEMALYVAKVDHERSKAENALLEETIWRRILIQESRDGIVVLDQTGKVYEANQKFADHLGYSAEDVLNLYVWDWDDQWTKEHLLGMIEAIDETGDHFETRHRRKDGLLVDVEISTNGAVRGGRKLVFCVCRDITDRKRAEEALWESEKRFQALSDASFESIFFSEKGICLDQNLTAERMFGYTREEAIGRHGTNWIIPADRELVRNNMLSGFEKPYEVIALRKDGTTFPAEIQGRMIKYKERQIRVTALRDITDRRLAEKALRESEERFREMAELLPEAIIEMDADLRITYVNQYGLEIYGYSQEDLAAGINGLDLLDPDDRENALEGITAQLAKKSLISTEYRGVKKNQESIWVLFNASPIYRDEEFAGYRVVMTDISKRKQIEKQRERLITELQDALAEIKELRGFLPICSSCKKIRDDKGYWQQIEKYIQDRTEAQFSHSICPDCARKLYPEFYID